MRIFIDTNILISALLNSRGTVFSAFCRAVAKPNTGVVCTQNIEELRRIFNRKFPDKVPLMESFLNQAALSLEIIDIPDSPSSEEAKIRDSNDQLIMRAAIAAGVDVLLTGDKDFLEAGITSPAIMSPADFVAWISVKDLGHSAN